MDLVQARGGKGAAAVAALHDLNLAARVSNRILVLKDGQAVALGPPGEVLTPALLRDVFGVRARVAKDPETGYLSVTVQGPA